MASFFAARIGLGHVIFRSFLSLRLVAVGFDGIVPKPVFDNLTLYAAKRRNFGAPAMEKAGNGPVGTPPWCQVANPRIPAVWYDPSDFDGKALRLLTPRAR